jgi:tellurium resistance protein TerZ
MYEGTGTRVNTVHSTFDIATDTSYAGKGAIILAKLYKRNNEWKFDAIGEPTNDRIFLETIQNIIKSYAK